MYVKAINESIERFPFSIAELRASIPNVSLPRKITVEFLAGYNVFPVAVEEKPTTDRFSYTVQKQIPSYENGSWVIKWDVLQKTEDQLAKDTERQKNEVREMRNDFLSNSDWTQISDAPVDKSAWETYRQALRDVPTQVGFPWEVNWPTQPE